MDKVIQLPKGTEIECTLSASPAIEHVVKATIVKYSRVYGTQTVIDESDPKKKKFFPVQLVEVGVTDPASGKSYKARIDVKCIKTNPLKVLKAKVEGK